MAKRNYAFGLHAVETLLQRHPEQVLELFVQNDRQDARVKALVEVARRGGVKPQMAQKKTLDKMTQGNHQGVVAVIAAGKNYTENDIEELVEAAGRDTLLLVLDGVTDPHNLGACLRSADAAGVTAVIVPKDKSVGITDVVRKVACGAAETVPFIQVTNLSRALKALQQLNVWVVGTAGEAESLVFDADLKGPLAIVMGAEGAGMRRLTRENCDILVKLPMAGLVSSLNVSVATGITLFEVVRQRSHAQNAKP